MLALLCLLLAQTPEPATKGTDAPSKKQVWLEKKAVAEMAGAADHRPAPARTAEHPLSLHNVWTDEILPVQPGHLPPAEVLNRFLRCHFTNQSTAMNEKLIPLVLRTAQRFRVTRVDIVSGYRSPKYNLMLRKKGHEVARESEHPKGEAIDFRLLTVPLRALMHFVRSLHLGGVGYYPQSLFVHADFGRVRFWKGH